MHEQSAFINDFDVEQLISESPLINESSNTSGSNEHLFDLEIILDDPELNLGIFLPGGISTNTFDDISTFVGILSPLDERESSVYTASTISLDAMGSPCFSYSSASSAYHGAAGATTTKTYHDDSGMITPDGKRIYNSTTPDQVQQKLHRLQHDKTMKTSPKKKNTSNTVTKHDTNSTNTNTSRSSTSSSLPGSPTINTPTRRSSITMNKNERIHNVNNILNSNSKSPKFKSYQSKDKKSSPIMKTNLGNIHKDLPSSPPPPSSSTAVTRMGRWSPVEHLLFLRGIAHYGRHWERVAKGVATRTTVQVRSHAQKYFKKLVLKERRSDDHTYTSSSTSSRPRSSGKMTSSSYELSDVTIMRNAAYDLHQMSTSL